MTNDDVDFSAELEQYLDQHDYDMPHPGDIRKGVVVAVSNDGVIIDLGLKRDGIVPPSDLSKLSDKEREALAVDQEISVYILETSQPDTLQVSIHRALINEDWIVAEEVMERGDIVEAEVVGYNRGGALVDYGRLRGFIPLSQLSNFRPGMKDRDKQRLLSKMRGEILPLKVIEVDRRRRRLVMSNREAQREWDEGRRAERIAELKAGTVVQGRVSSLRDFGAFVELGDSLEGLIHVSELSWHRIDHPQEVVKVGEELEVYILKVDEAEQRVSLSRKRLLPDPWTTVEEKYPLNSLVEGKITRIVSYGAFVELEPGIEGLLHASKMLRGSDNADPFKVVQEGEVHLLRVINVDADRQRIGLSLRAVTPKEQIDWMMATEAAAAAAGAEAGEEAEDAETAVDSAVETAEEAVDAVAEAAEPVVEAAEDAVAAAGEVAAEAAEPVGEAAEETIEAAEEAAADTAEPAVEAVEETMEAAAEAAEPAAEAAGETVAAAVEAAADAAEPVVEAVEETMEAATEAVEETVAAAAEVVEPVVEAAEETVAAAVEATADAAEPVVEAVEETLEAAAEAAEPVVEAVEETVEAAVEVAADAVEPVVEAVEETMEAAAEAAEPMADAAEESVETAIEAVEPVAEAVEEVADSATEAANPVVEAVEEAIEEKQTAVESAVEAAAEEATETAEELVQAEADPAEDAGDGEDEAPKT